MPPSGRTGSAPRPRGRRRPPPAFTLLEVLIALAILSTAIGGALAVFAAAARSHTRAVHSTEAALIAQSVAAEARARFKASVSLPPVVGGKFPGKPRYTYYIDYVALDKEGDEVVMNVRVEWHTGGRETSYSFATILLRKSE